MYLIHTYRSEHRRIRLVNSPSFKNFKVKGKSNQQTLLHNSTTNTHQHTYTLPLTYHLTSFLKQIYPPPSRPISSPTRPPTPLLPVDLYIPHASNYRTISHISSTARHYIRISPKNCHRITSTTSSTATTIANYQPQPSSPSRSLGSVWNTIPRGR